MESTYLVRYGLMRQVGRFLGDAADFARGQSVVVRSPRGTELGEILASAASEPAARATAWRVLRAAGPHDLASARRAELERPGRLEACERVFRDGIWPLQLLDVEPILDDRRTVLYYLGPHHLDAEGLIGAFRDLCGLDVVLEPLGRDEPAPVEEHGCGSCGSGGGCGSSGGGCGSSSEAHGACSGCAVMAARRSPARAH